MKNETPLTYICILSDQTQKTQTMTIKMKFLNYETDRTYK